MNRFQTNLRLPGPTSLPDAVREAGARQMINHRGPEFAAMLARVTRRLRGSFRTVARGEPAPELAAVRAASFRAR